MEQNLLQGRILKEFSIICFSLLLLTSTAAAFIASGTLVDANLAIMDGFTDGNTASASGTYTGSFLIPVAPTGTWANSDGSYLFRVGEFFDQNLPVVSITSPTQNSHFSSSTVLLEYSVVEYGNPVNNFWVRVDSESWVNNGLNFSYTFNGLSDGSHTLTVIATDSSDLNSAATVSVTVNTSPAGSSLPTATQTGGTTGGPGSGGPSTPTTLAISIADVENEAKIVKKVDYEPVVSSTPQGVEVSREASYREIKASSGGIAPVYAFDVGVRNTTKNTLKNIKVRETIPKAIARDVSMITFKDYPTSIIKADPEVEWLVEELAPSEERKFFYFVKELSDKSIAKNFDQYISSVPTSEVKAEVKREDLACSRITCDDENICTADSCLDGICYHDGSARDGMNCGGPTRVCSDGKCVDRSSLMPVQPEGPLKEGGLEAGGLDGLLAGGALVALVVVVLVVLGVIVFMFRKPKKKF